MPQLVYELTIWHPKRGKDAVTHETRTFNNYQEARREIAKYKKRKVMYEGRWVEREDKS